MLHHFKNTPSIMNCGKTSTLGLIGQQIYQKLMNELHPSYLEVIDESGQHKGHKGVAQCQSGETHFKIIIASTQFKDIPLLQRHRMIYSILNLEFQSPHPIHSLVIEKAVVSL